MGTRAVARVRSANGTDGDGRNVPSGRKTARDDRNAQRDGRSHSILYVLVCVHVHAVKAGQHQTFVELSGPRGAAEEKEVFAWPLVFSFGAEERMQGKQKCLRMACSFSQKDRLYTLHVRNWKSGWVSVPVNKVGSKCLLFPANYY